VIKVEHSNRSLKRRIYAREPLPFDQASKCDVFTLRIPLREKEKDMMQVHRSRAKEEGKKEWSSSSFFIEFIG
jgi:hypothetical protein